MFLLNLNYIQPAAKVAAHREAHRAWVKKYVTDDIFLIGGPKKSETGGIILVRSISKDLLKEILAEDPYTQADVAEYQIFDFDAMHFAKGLELLKTA